MSWLMALAIIILFTGIQVAMTRRWRPRFPERVVPIYRRRHYAPETPTEIWSRKFLLILGPFIAVQLGAVGGVLAAMTHVVWVNGLTILAELYALEEVAWAYRHTAQHPKNRLAKTTPNQNSQ